MLAEHSSPSPLSKLYHRVKTAMLAVHEARASQESVDALLKVASEWWVLVALAATSIILPLPPYLPSSNTSPSSRVTQSQDPASRIDKRTAFKMMLWLVTYYELFCNKVCHCSLRVSLL